MKNGKVKKILILSIIFFFMAVLYSSGVTSTGTGIKFGWREKFFGNKWIVSYMYYSGIREKMLTVDETEYLYLKVITNKGKITIEISDESGKIVFFEDDMKSGESKIEIKGTIKIKVIANGHSGGFEFRVK